MGYYINPSDGSEKEAWLEEHAVFITKYEAKDFDFETSPDLLPVCLVDNGAFTAAAIAYDAMERDRFIEPDHRPKIWYLVKKELVKEWYHHK